MDGFLGFIGIILIVTGMIILIVKLIKRKKKRNAFVILLVGFLSLISGFIIFVKNADNTNKVTLPYKDIIETKLKKIGVENIKEVFEPQILDNGKEEITVSVNDFDYDYTLSVIMSKKDDWYVEKIFGKHDSKYYFVDDIARYDENHNERYNIYNYKTNEQIAKEYIKPLTEEERNKLENERLTREQEELDKSKTILDEIGSAFDRNSISASEQYQDKQYLITATVDEVDTTITGKPRIYVYQNDYSVQCVFNEGMVEKVKTLNKGDTITFYGTLDGWGISADFTNCYFK